VLQENLDGLGVVLHYLTNGHLSGNGLHPNLPSIVLYMSYVRYSSVVWPG
jgi:hypothetical protein